MKAATILSSFVSCIALISIHAAREGGDWNAPSVIELDATFQSTPPVKAATSRRKMSPLGFAISIHAAREGGDVYNDS